MKEKGRQSNVTYELSSRYLVCDRGDISKSRVLNKVPEGSTLILELREFPYNSFRFSGEH